MKHAYVPPPYTAGGDGIFARLPNGMRCQVAKTCSGRLSHPLPETVTAEAQAAFIITACNAFGSLAATLEAIRDRARPDDREGSACKALTDCRELASAALGRIDAAPELIPSGPNIIDLNEDLVEAVRLALRALNTVPRFKVDDGDSYAIAAHLARVLERSKGRAA